MNPALPTAAELFSLDGTVAVVTGATSGIGLATAGALASAGASTVLTGLDADRPDEVAARLAATGLPVAGRTCDVTDASEVATLVEAVLAEYGRLDTVFCNAGVALDPAADAGLDERIGAFDRMLDVHVRSVLRLADAALPAMADAGGGSFVIMSSIAGLRGNRSIGLYGVTKAANAQIARNLAVQWGRHGVRVNAVSPGVIATDFARPITADATVARARLAKTPLGTFGDPAHIAGTVLWLASRAGGFVTGQNIVVDGGTLISD